MQLYHNIPYGKVIFYVFTILFHLFLLIRSAYEARYLLSAILVIPVFAVSLVLYKFLKKTVINIFLIDSSFELATAFDRFKSDKEDMKIQDSEVVTKGRKFSINLKKAENLIKVLNQHN